MHKSKIEELMNNYGEAGCIERRAIEDALHIYFHRRELNYEVKGRKGFLDFDNIWHQNLDDWLDSVYSHLLKKEKEGDYHGQRPKH